MTRTEYLLNRLVNVCGEMSSSAASQLIYHPLPSFGPSTLEYRIKEFTAVVELLVREGALGKDDHFEKTVADQVKVIEELYQSVEKRKAKGAIYQLKESPLTDLPKFHEELRAQFPEIAKRKALRVYESEKTEPFMDLLNSYTVGLQEVKT